MIIHLYTYLYILFSEISMMVLGHVNGKFEIHILVSQNLIAMRAHARCQHLLLCSIMRTLLLVKGNKLVQKKRKTSTTRHFSLTKHYITSSWQGVGATLPQFRKGPTELV